MNGHRHVRIHPAQPLAVLSAMKRYCLISEFAWQMERDAHSQDSLDRRIARPFAEYCYALPVCPGQRDSKDKRPFCNYCQRTYIQPSNLLWELSYAWFHDQAKARYLREVMDVEDRNVREARGTLPLPVCPQGDLEAARELLHKARHDEAFGAELRSGTASSSTTSPPDGDRIPRWVPVPKSLLVRPRQVQPKQRQRPPSSPTPPRQTSAVSKRKKGTTPEPEA